MFKKGINSYLNLDEANELIDGIDTCLLYTSDAADD
mgnify:CR=1 FL=1